MVLGVLLLLTPWIHHRLRVTISARAHLEQGILLMYAGDAAGAEREWAAARDISPRSATAYRALGTLFLSQGRFPEARRVLHRLADLDPSEPHTLCRLAEAEYRRGTAEEIEAAAVDAARAAEMEPHCPRALRAAGDAWVERGNARAGLDYLRRAVRLNRADIPLTLHFVQSLLEGQQLAEATAVAEQLTRRYPGYAQAYALASACYRYYPAASPEARRAGGMLERAVALDPTNALARAQLGRLLLDRNEARQAIAHLEAARFLNPGRAATAFDLSRAYREVGRLAEARREAGAFTRRSDLENELSALEKQAVVRPDNRMLLGRMAGIAEELGEHERAERYRKRLSGAPRGGSSP